MKQLPPTTIDQIIQDAQAGIDSKAIGEKFGILTNSVSRILRKKGIERTGKTRIGKKAERTIISQYLAGKTAASIAEIMGVNTSSITRLLKRNGIGKSMVRTINSPQEASKISLKGSNPANYSTTYYIPYKGQPLNKETVAKLSTEEKEEAAVIARDYFREHGFPYPFLSDDELIRGFNTFSKTDPSSIVVEGNVLRTDNQSGISIIKHFSPHFFEVNSGKSSKLNIIDSFNDDELLLKVIKNRLSQGYHINGNMLRQGLNTSKVAYKASIFNAVLAKKIYTEFSKEGDIIFDYSMGFGQRLLAALSLPHRVKYVGVDVLQKSVASNQAIADFFNRNIPMLNREVSLHCVGSEDFCPKELEGKVDLAFSSPPYFNLEVYDRNDDKQACNRSYSSFLNDYFKKTVENIDRMLSPDGILILNINDEVAGFNIGRDMTNAIRERGFEPIKTYQIRLTRNLQFNNKSGEHKLEPIYVFKRK